MRALVRIVGLALVILIVGPLGAARAAPPTLAITSPVSGSTSNDQAPSFSGTTTQEEFSEFYPVTISIYAGEQAAGAAVQTLTTSETPMWSAGPAAALAPGVYTAVAEQQEPCFQHPFGAGCPSGQSAPVTFTIDTTAPEPTLASPSNGSSTSDATLLLGGRAGTAPGDLPKVTVQLFAGSTVGPEPFESLAAQASGGEWSAPVGGLSPGTYAVRAEQRDAAGNLGVSVPSTFTLTAPSPSQPPAPSASFAWFPTAPQIGETITLISSSTDSVSPITAFSWTLGSAAALTSSQSLLTTSFSTAGLHTVQLRVTAADGLTSVASSAIRVVSPAVTVMQPFPIVRLAGALTSSGAVLRVLTAQAPVGAHVVVVCHGRGCPTGSVSRIAASTATSKAGTAVIGFPRFERQLPAGVVLEVKVFKAAAIGKYTRFRIRHGKLPTRADACLGPEGATPIACPS